jgi:hypothetical protein
MKGNTKKKLYDDLSNLIDNEYPKYTGYYVEIIPAQPGKYDKPFVPSDNTGGEIIERDDLRVIDGPTFYDLIEGLYRPNYLYDEDHNQIDDYENQNSIIKIIYELICAITPAILANYDKKSINHEERQKFSQLFNYAFEKATEINILTSTQQDNTFSARFHARKNEGILIDEVVERKTSRYTYKCNSDNHKEFSLTLNDLQKGQWCPMCNQPDLLDQV